MITFDRNRQLLTDAKYILQKHLRTKAQIDIHGHSSRRDGTFTHVSGDLFLPKEKKNAAGFTAFLRPDGSAKNIIKWEPAKGLFAILDATRETFYRKDGTRRKVIRHQKGYDTEISYNKKDIPTRMKFFDEKGKEIKK